MPSKRRTQNRSSTSASARKKQTPSRVEQEHTELNYYNKEKKKPRSDGTDQHSSTSEENISKTEELQISTDAGNHSHNGGNTSVALERLHMIQSVCRKFLIEQPSTEPISNIVNGQYRDVVFIVDDAHFYCAAHFINTRSRVLGDLIKRSMFKDDIYRVHIQNTSSALFRLVLEYMVTGNSSPTDLDTAIDLFVYAKEYLEDEDIARQPIMKLLNPIIQPATGNPVTAWSVLNRLTQLGENDSTSYFSHSNSRILFQNTSFLINLNEKCLEHFLRTSLVGEMKEVETYKAVMAWSVLRSGTSHNKTSDQTLLCTLFTTLTDNDIPTGLFHCEKNNYMYVIQFKNTNEVPVTTTNVISNDKQEIMISSPMENIRKVIQPFLPYIRFEYFSIHKFNDFVDSINLFSIETLHSITVAMTKAKRNKPYTMLGITFNNSRRERALVSNTIAYQNIRDQIKSHPWKSSYQDLTHFDPKSNPNFVLGSYFEPTARHDAMDVDLKEVVYKQEEIDLNMTNHENSTKVIQVGSNHTILPFNITFKKVSGGGSGVIDLEQENQHASSSVIVVPSNNNSSAIIRTPKKTSASSSPNNTPSPSNSNQNNAWKVISPKVSISPTRAPPLPIPLYSAPVSCGNTKVELIKDQFVYSIDFDALTKYTNKYFMPEFISLGTTWFLCVCVNHRANQVASFLYNKDLADNKPLKEDMMINTNFTLYNANHPNRETFATFKPSMLCKDKNYVFASSIHLDELKNPNNGWFYTSVETGQLEIKMGVKVTKRTT
ncbi:hypothetical protein AKO1_002978 [Acrasis kona]|uniref:BTB domain-containing protein n=1 Tax=Acrasis kona TaxID=1008807 RepID=A0AAW2Z6D1_9EUKA